MKSHVSIEQKVCAICGKTNDSGAILLEKNLRKSLEKFTVTGYNHCDDCNSKLSDQFIAAVEISNKEESAILKNENAIRTGVIVWIKKRLAREIFNVPEIHSPLVFVTHEVVEFLKNLQANAE